ncbi:Ig-like domain-containing protein [Bacillaceae bacterium Marseille-Q3522]|nr:Ig-like domain-containing protein [Bacillaceae bacterium Marseille-Q3522]
MVDTYSVYRDGNLVASELAEKTFTDSGLTPNTEYSYEVSAVNIAGESERSDPLSVTTNYSAPTSVSISPLNNNLTTSGTRTLNATVSPATARQSVTWSSSNTSVATVNSSGLVTAVGPGTATITAKAADNQAVQGTATINVTQPVTGVSVTPATANLTVTGTQQLTPTVSPANASNKNVVYSSSNEAIATVNSSGLITAVAEGSATITVTTADGSFTDTCAVTVTAA